LTIDPTSQRVFVGPIELPSQFITQPLPLDPLSSEPEGARFQSNIDVPPLLTSFFDVFWEIDLSPNNPNTGPIRLENMDVVPDAPSGIADRAPIAMGVATVQGIGVVDSFFDIFYQISGEGRGVSGNPIPIRFDQLELTPLGLGNVLRVRARVQSINPGSEPFTGFTIRQDFRGFARLGGGGGGPSCGSIDFNNDTSFFDPTDIEAFLSVFSEGPCIPVTATCNSIDFNNDTSFFDPCDIDSFLLVFSEGPCTLCGV
jgi:hypothetical protein